MSLFKSNKPQAVDELINELRVLIDQRNGSQGREDNVVNLHRQAQSKELDGKLEKYQQLIGPTKEFFSKQGEEVSYEALVEYLETLKNLRDSDNKG